MKHLLSIRHEKLFLKAVVKTVTKYALLRRTGGSDTKIDTFQSMRRFKDV